jgi:hypothetical protein
MTHNEKDQGIIQRQKPTLLFPAFMAVLVVVLAVWAFYALNTGDPRWFLAKPARTYTPERILVHYYGATTTLEPGSEAFRTVSTALNHALSDVRGRIAVGLSQATVRDYREREYTLEVFFAGDIGPVIGLGVPLNHLLIPVDGRHSGNRYVFVGNDDKWLASALVMAEPEPLISTLAAVGYPIENREK